MLHYLLWRGKRSSKSWDIETSLSLTNILAFITQDLPENSVTTSNNRLQIQDLLLKLSNNGPMNLVAKVLNSSPLSMQDNRGTVVWKLPFWFGVAGRSEKCERFNDLRHNNYRIVWCCLMEVNNLNNLTNRNTKMKLKYLWTEWDTKLHNYSYQDHLVYNIIS